MTSTSSQGNQARLLTCGVELELELKPKPGLQSKHEDIFKKFGSSHQELILAAIIQESLEGSDLNISCLGVNSEEYRAALHDGSIHQSWKVMSEPIQPTEDENC